MSTLRCHMKAFFSHFIVSIPPSIYILFHMQHPWSSVETNQLTVIHSDDNKSRHYHIYLGPSLKRREKEIFLSGGRITYDPFMSCWEPLKIIIHHSRSTYNWNAQSVINLMGFAYFAFLKLQAKEITWHILKKQVVRKHRQELGFTLRQTCSSRTLLWLKMWGLQGESFFKNSFLNSSVWKTQSQEDY